MNLNNTSDTMPEFIPILVAAIIVFIVLLLAFGGLVMPNFIQNTTKSDTLIKGIELASDFMVSDSTKQTHLTTITNSTVSNGLTVYAEDATSFKLSRSHEVSEGIINVKVLDTNLYGPLIFEVNGNPVYSDFARKGRHEIKIPGSVLDYNNSVIVKAGSSGWKFWAPTTYIIDANVSAVYFGRNIHNNTFVLTPTEFNRINKAKIVLDVANRSGTGEITVEVNDILIYSGYGSTGREFSKNILKQGENVVEISTQADAIFNVDLLKINLWG
jgi:hypothetical protein